MGTAQKGVAGRHDAGPPGAGSQTGRRELPQTPFIQEAPADHDAEFFTLSACLRGCADTVLDLLSGVPDPFLDPFHAELFGHISAMRADGEPVNICTIAPRLDQRNTPLAVKMVNFSASHTDDSVAYYAAKVCESAQKRQALVLMARAAAAINGGDDALYRKTMAALREEGIGGADSMLTDFSNWRAEALEPFDFLIPNWLQRRAVTVLGSAGGVGKSFLSLALAIQCITGNEMLSGLGGSGRESVLLIDLENDDKTTKKRIAGYEHHYNIDPAYMDECVAKRLHVVNRRGAWVEHHPGGRALVPTKAYQSMVRLCRTHKPGLIIIDHLRRISGPADGQDNALMGYMLELCDRLATEANAAVLLLAHTNKAARSNEPGAANIRGASSIVDEARSAWEMRRDGELLTLVRVKANNASTLQDPIAFKMTKTLDTVCLEVADLEKIKEDEAAKSDPRLEWAVLEVVRTFEGGLTRTDLVEPRSKDQKARGNAARPMIAALAKGCTVSISSLTPVVKRLLSTGRLRQAGEVGKRSILVADPTTDPTTGDLFDPTTPYNKPYNVVGLNPTTDGPLIGGGMKPPTLSGARPSSVADEALDPLYEEDDDLDKLF